MKDYIVKTSTSEQLNEFIDQHFYKNTFCQIRKKENVIDCFGSSWGIFFPVQNGHVNIKVRNQSSYIDLNATDIIFCPPFALLETQMPKNIKYSFKTITSSWPLNGNFRSPIIKKTNLSFEAISKNRDSILSFIDSLSDGIELNQELVPSSIARKFKNCIDLNYEKYKTITSITKILNHPREVLVRSFIKTYGLAPSAYLNRLKIFEALFYINNGVALSSICTLVGYSDPSSLIFNFKKQFGVTPKSYKLRN